MRPTAFESPIRAFVAAVTAIAGAPDATPVPPLSISLGMAIAASIALCAACGALLPLNVPSFCGIIPAIAAAAAATIGGGNPPPTLPVLPWAT